ncbi:MAG TPA: ATP-binding protein [Candidatus Acidoferrales bacterium]|nr:ATP-binding protein [Candidatus Acidoferrales bacterium]
MEFSAALGKTSQRMTQHLLLRLEFLSDPSLLCVVRAAMEQLTEKFGFAAPECRSITRAVDEALSNIMKHAYGGQPGRPIEMLCRRVSPQPAMASSDGLEILLSDHGPEVDPSKLCGRHLDEIKPGGLGLHFIKESMDNVEFSRTGGVNQLRLVKYLSDARQRSQ